MHWRPTGRSFIVQGHSACKSKPRCLYPAHAAAIVQEADAALKEARRQLEAVTRQIAEARAGIERAAAGVAESAEAAARVRMTACVTLCIHEQRAICRACDQPALSPIQSATPQCNHWRLVTIEACRDQGFKCIWVCHI